MYSKLKWVLVVPLVLASFGMYSGETLAAAYKSKADMILEGKVEIVPPVNPVDPTKPVKPVKPGKPGTPGPLSIDYASSIQFGKHKIADKDVTFYANLEQVIQLEDGKQLEVPNYVQVTDDRGNNGGWQLNVKQASQLKNGNHVLEGAQLTLLNTKLASPSHGNEPIVNNNIELNPVSGESSQVMFAKADQGTGTWVSMFGGDVNEGKSSIKLTVPGETKKYEGNYSTTLIWELLDSPI
ncbi:WxL domain-containing protein [Listeria weihenstephanensis]|uniref:WxL domain-containing protein n=1 Tax=Listeria weihenstephanensis TaxID=1006155 RepID=A0A841Z8Z5_9LIST|nr:WxL domain-containing protein [Listeria weihenstephanensis]MBC1501329.1 WxL domain-containing protein [Listeria weihenstephanensis]